MRTLFCLVLGFLATTAPSEARTLDQIRKEGVLRVAVDAESPPFNFYKGKELTGFEVDLATEVAKRLGVKVEWKVQPFNTLLVAISQDRFDLIATSHAITPEREKVVDFTLPHYCTAVVLVSKSNGPKKASELTGKTVALLTGTVYYDRMKKIPGIKEIRTLPNETDGLQAVLGDRADAWVTEKFIAADAIKKNPDRGLGLGESVLDNRNAMVVAKGNQSLLQAFNLHFSAIVKDGTYEKLKRKYFDAAEELRCK